MIGTHVSVTDDLALLLGVMPPHIRSLLEEHAKHDVLLVADEVSSVGAATVVLGDGDVGVFEPFEQLPLRRTATSVSAASRLSMMPPGDTELL